MDGVIVEQGFEELTELWEDALTGSSSNFIFLTPAWQRIWWEEFGKGSQLQLTTIPVDSAVGIAPLMLTEGVLSLIGNTDLFDYRDFIVPGGAEEEFFRSLLDRLEPLRWESIEMPSLREGSPTLDVLPSVAREEWGYQVHVEAEDNSPGMALPSTWDEFVSSLSKKDRHELRRKVRRLQGAGAVRLDVLTEPQAVDDSMDDFFNLLRKSRRDKSKFLTDERERFFRRMARELAEKDQVRLHFLELDGVRVASALCLDYDGSIYLYNSGYDPDYSALSVGLVGKAYCIKDAIESGREYFDFLRGSESYKYHLGGADRAIYAMTISRGGL